MRKIIVIWRSNGTVVEVKKKKKKSTTCQAFKNDLSGKLICVYRKFGDRKLETDPIRTTRLID